MEPHGSHSRMPSEEDPSAWIDQWMGPRHGEEVRRLFDALSRITDASPFLTRVRRFVVDGPLRGELGITLYDETAWGVIRWSRKLGRPVPSRLAEGFVVTHQYLFVVDLGVCSDGSTRWVQKWLEGGQPQVWDGPDDEETYAVSFMVRGITYWTNRVVVDLAPGVAWQPADEPWQTQRRRIVSYPPALPGGEFEISRGGAPIDLGRFEVFRTW
jgi:hypothetical protein